MTQNNRSCTTSGLLALLAFVVGLIIGLVVLGWWVWPVTWTDASLEALDQQAQEDYLRAAIDSYTLIPDDSLAVFRFGQLGANGPAVIAAIYVSPDPQSKTEVEQFAVAVNASEALAGEIPPTPAPVAVTQPLLTSWITGQPVWLTLCLLGLLILLLFLVVIRLVSRSRRKQVAAPTITTTSEVIVAPDAEELVEAAEPAPEIGETASKTQPTYVAKSSAEPSEIEQGDIPEWLIDTSETEILPAEPPQTEARARELSDLEIEEISATTFPFENESESPPLERAEGAAEGQPVEGELHFPSMTRNEHQEEPAPFAEPAPEAPTIPAGLPISEEVREVVSEQPAGAGQLPLGEETPDETYQKFSAGLQSIPGLGADEVERLQDAGISAPLLLLKNGSSAQGRSALVEQTGIDADQLLDAVRFVDLLRIKGLTKRDASALKEAGINTLADLASSDSADLFEKLQVQPKTPDAAASSFNHDRVANWIEQAKQLPGIVT